MYKKLLAFAGITALSFTSSVSAAWIDPIPLDNNGVIIKAKEDFSQYLRSGYLSGYRMYFGFNESETTGWFHLKKWNVCFVSSVIGEASSMQVDLIRDDWGPSNPSMGRTSQPVDDGKMYRHQWNNIEEGSYQLRFTTNNGYPVAGNGTLKNC